MYFETHHIFFVAFSCLIISKLFLHKSVQCSGNFHTFNGDIGFQVKKHIFNKIRIVMADSYELIERLQH